MALHSCLDLARLEIRGAIQNERTERAPSSGPRVGMVVSRSSRQP
jgi:hypothetical protein